jgi:hypothetical protein
MKKAEVIFLRKDTVCWFADNYGWHNFENQPEVHLLRFEKENVVINVWVTKMTISIVIDGKQYFHKKVSDSQLELMFINPTNFKN